MSDAEEPRRAVVDLNLFVSGLLSRLGAPHRLVEHLRQDSFVLVISRELRAELEEVLQREKFVRFGLTAERRSGLLSLIDAKAAYVEPDCTLPRVVRDPKDEIVLATALAGHADFLVTGDADLLVLKDHPLIGLLRILTVREFLAIVDG